MATQTHLQTTNHNLLTPDHAYLQSSTSLPHHSLSASRSRHHNRSRSRRRKPPTWKKLLWVKQSYPDNYTDEETFLDALQRNPRLRPYEFWPLMADSTVIVQQVCTMIVFVCCFSGIMQERVSPVTVVTWGTVGAVLGWAMWDRWVSQEEAEAAAAKTNGSLGQIKERDGLEDLSSSMNATLSRAVSTASFARARESDNTQPQGLGLKLAPVIANTSTSSAPQSSNTNRRSQPPSRSHSRNSSNGSTRITTLKDLQQYTLNPPSQSHPNKPTESPSSSHPSPDPQPPTRTRHRLTTAKSAILIMFALLGLSPILKSLTKSTASDSIWAIAFWLMLINVIFFDYGGGVGATFPASLSTNAALMASTVLASRLAIGGKSGGSGSGGGAASDALSTAHVFSLTLFSIEVFGLFPVFRRYLRHVSWGGHLSLTWALVIGAGAGVTMVLSGGAWTAAIVGAVLGSVLTGLAMGICAWWLIGLQRFKNEIHGPWDPARPVIRRWD